MRLAERCVAGVEELVWKRAYSSAWKLLSRLLESRHDGTEPRVERAAVYVHIPFCGKPCQFCCFVRFPAYEHNLVRYYKLLGREISEVSSRMELRATHVHVGGGTPAVEPYELAELVDKMRECFGRFTLTIEIHPENVLNDESLEVLKSIKPDRVSLGVQSFHDELLQRLGRYSHNGREALEATKRSAGLAPTVNIDLVWGIPGQSVQEALEDLKLALDSGVNQITLYPLLGAARIRHPEAFKMYTELINLARSKGWVNSTPWTINATPTTINEYIIEDEDYVGFGVSSISMIRGVIYANTFNVSRYEKLVEAGRWSAVMKTRMKQHEKIGYMIMNALEVSVSAVANVLESVSSILSMPLRLSMYLAGEARRAVYAALTRFRRSALTRGV
ncbi:Radical SAM domain protein [Pyrolobus fumarii 1A]|uniref:Radical SAM domain protein n=1 Tax=Pyrolobus fumarii (strain DSM 11204 / 1A) TaxID=694429 RepID=G0EDQ1_PYRF1|nr:radical SAM protein [Pyrolobus fumarii]AEM37888.1 Radical SAM domain protein [Pyrolobus fumarii 1A]